MACSLLVAELDQSSCEGPLGLHTDLCPTISSILHFARSHEGEGRAVGACREDVAQKLATCSHRKSQSTAKTNTSATAYYTGGNLGLVLGFTSH